MHHPKPVYDGYFADPFAWRSNGAYYAVGTGPSAREESGPRHFPMLRSEDFVRWESIGHALLPVDPELGNTFWAPEVAERGGAFHMYYSVGFGDKRHQIRVAISERPEGPYEDVGRPLTDLASCPFAIDAHPFRDDDGEWYLFHSRDFLDTDAGFRAGTGIVVDRLLDMTRLAGEERTVARARHDWQRFAADRPMYGGVYDWHTLEGPCVLKRDGRYYCLYSGGCWKNDTYGVDYVVSESPLGPYHEPSSGEAPRVLRSTPSELVGPGHNSVVTGPKDDEQYMVYHAWDHDHTARQMRIGKLRWTDEGPVCL